MNKKILVTGGLGYIGSHIICELSKNDYDIVIIDNLSNSSTDKIKEIEKFTDKNIFFYNYDLRDDLSLIFDLHTFYAVIHLAGFKSVNESIDDPIGYYENNICSTLNLCKYMKKHGIKNLIFSSSASVYGNGNISPLTEKSICGIGITNPYAKSKYLIEEILKDCKELNIVILRYFNPISSIFSEKYDKQINNLYPFVVNVYNKVTDKLKIFGNNYLTSNGTCVRDFIDIRDVASAHIKCLDIFLENKTRILKIYNIGTGQGTTVLELIHIFEMVNNTKIPIEFVGRRPGDIDIVYANCDKIYKELGWKAKYSLEESVKQN